MRFVIVFCLVVNSLLAAVSEPKVDTIKASKTTIENNLLFPVKVESRINSTLIADGNYIVIKENVELGKKVKKGDLLLTLRNQDTSVHYEKRQIRAQVDGVISQIYVDIGQFVNKGDLLIKINDPSKLYGKIEISPLDFSKIKKGQKAKITIPSLGKKAFLGEVSGVGSGVDSISGTISSELNLDASANLIPGLVGMAEITLDKEDLLLVKEKSLYYIGEETFVASVKGKKVKKLPVKIGKRYKEEIEILEGLELGTEYIVASPKFLRDGEKVVIKTKEKSQ